MSFVSRSASVRGGAANRKNVCQSPAHQRLTFRQCYKRTKCAPSNSCSAMSPSSRLEDILNYTRLAASTALEIADGVNVPYLRATANLSLTIVDNVPVSCSFFTTYEHYALSEQSLCSLPKMNLSGCWASSMRFCVQLSAYIRVTIRTESCRLRYCQVHGVRPLSLCFSR